MELGIENNDKNWVLVVKFHIFEKKRNFKYTQNKPREKPKKIKPKGIHLSLKIIEVNEEEKLSKTPALTAQKPKLNKGIFKIILKPPPLKLVLETFLRDKKAKYTNLIE